MAATVDPPAPPTLSSPPSQSTKALSKSLSVNDLLFVNAYMTLARNGTKTYQSLHLKCSYDVASARAYQILQKPSVQAELARRVRVDSGITKEFVQSNLLHALTLANEAKDASVIASISMDCAKLAGYLVDKRSDVTPSSEQQSAVSTFVQLMLSSDRTMKLSNGHGDTKSGSGEDQPTIQTPTPPPA